MSATPIIRSDDLRAAAGKGLAALFTLLDPVPIALRGGGEAAFALIADGHRVRPAPDSATARTDTPSSGMPTARRGGTAPGFDGER